MGTNAKQATVILVAEDDEDDYILFRDALNEADWNHALYWVKDGAELMNYLLHQNHHANPDSAPKPDLIILDLNMPKKDGRVALKEIKAHPALRRIPVIALTTSQDQQDHLHTYDLGVNSLILKPVRFQDFVTIAKALKKYWSDVVHLPHHSPH